MRNKKVRELYPFRHAAIKILREHDDLHNYIDNNGNSIFLNLRKHYYLGIPYKNEEYKMEFERNRNTIFKEGQVIRENSV